MSERGAFGPKRVNVEGVSYDYRRFVLEIMECLTCKAVFQTHIPSGSGVLMAEEDAELCPGCEEVCRNLDLTEKNGGKPS